MIGARRVPGVQTGTACRSCRTWRISTSWGVSDRAGIANRPSTGARGSEREATETIMLAIDRAAARGRRLLAKALMPRQDSPHRQGPAAGDEVGVPAPRGTTSTWPPRSPRPRRLKNRARTRSGRRHTRAMSKPRPFPPPPHRDESWGSRGPVTNPPARLPFPVPRSPARSGPARPAPCCSTRRSRADRNRPAPMSTGAQESARSSPGRGG